VLSVTGGKQINKNEVFSDTVILYLVAVSNHRCTDAKVMKQFVCTFVKPASVKFRDHPLSPCLLKIRQCQQFVVFVFY